MEQISHFAKARTEMEAVLRDRPTDAIALREMEHLNQEISDGHDKTYMDYVPAAAGGGLGLILVAGAGMSVARRRRRVASAAGSHHSGYRPATPTVAPNYKLLIQGRMLPLVQGTSLTTSDLPFLHSTGVGAVATIQPYESGGVGIRNDSSDSWEATRPDGSSQIVAPSETVLLVAGLRISFGAAHGVVHG